MPYSLISNFCWIYLTTCCQSQQIPWLSSLCTAIITVQTWSPLARTLASLSAFTAESRCSANSHRGLSKLQVWPHLSPNNYMLPTSSVHLSFQHLYTINYLFQFPPYLYSPPGSLGKDHFCLVHYVSHPTPPKGDAVDWGVRLPHKDSQGLQDALLHWDGSQVLLNLISPCLPLLGGRGHHTGLVFLAFNTYVDMHSLKIIS